MEIYANVIRDDLLSLGDGAEPLGESGKRLEVSAGSQACVAYLAVLRARQREDGTAFGEGCGHLRSDGDAGSGGDEWEDCAEVVGLEDRGSFCAGVLAGGEHVVAEAVALLEEHEALVGEIDVFAGQR